MEDDLVQLEKAVDRVKQDCVLILVVVEDDLVHIEPYSKNAQGARSLNPCCSGR